MYSTKFALLAGIAGGIIGVAQALAAQSTPQPPARPKAEAKEKTAIERFCDKVPPSVEELRIALQKKELEALDEKLRERIEALEKVSKSTQEWIEKRTQMLKTAEQSVVSIYAKSDPEAAAKQFDEMQEEMAAAILSKLNSQQASAILGEMSASKASKIVSAIRGDAGNENKM